MMQSLDPLLTMAARTSGRRASMRLRRQGEPQAFQEFLYLRIVTVQFLAVEGEEIVPDEERLGRFGEVLLGAGHRVGAFDRVRLSIAEPALHGVVAAARLRAVVGRLDARVVEPEHPVVIA